MSQSAGFRHVFSAPKSAALVILGMCEFVRGALLFFILPIYVRGVLGLSPDIMGYATAAHYTLDTGLRSLSGWFTDRFGQRNVLLAALGIGWVGLWLIVRAHHAEPLIVGAALLGLGMATVWPAVISRMTGDISARTQATAMGGVIMAWLLGAGSGAVSMSWFLGDHVRRGFAFLILIWFTAIVLSFYVMQGRQPSSSFRRRRKRIGFVRLIRDVHGARLLFPGMFVQTFAMGLLLPVFVLYARYELGLDGKTYSYLLMAGGAATVLLQIPVGRLVDHFGYKRFLVGGFALSAIILPVIVHLHQLSQIFLAVGALGMAYAFILPSWNSVLALSVPEKRRGVMWGIFMTVEGLGMAVGPLVGGQLWNSISPTAPFYAAAAILFFMTAFYTVAPLERAFQSSRIGKHDDREGHIF